MSATVIYGPFQSKVAQAAQPERRITSLWRQSEARRRAHEIIAILDALLLTRSRESAYLQTVAERRERAGAVIPMRRRG